MSLARQFNTRPLYQQVADEFASRLVSGEWAPGQTIANETDIARSLGISLGTVRKAFDILVELGLLERHQGRGTVVPDEGRNNRRARFSNIRDIDGNRITGEIEIADVRMTTPSVEDADLLAVNQRTPVLAFERRRRFMSRIFMIEDVVLRVDASLKDADEATQRSRAQKRWSGMDIATKMTESAQPGNASSYDAGLLGLTEGALILQLDRVVRSYQDRPLEVRHARCHLGADLRYACG